MSDNARFSTTELLHAIRQIPRSLITYVEKHVLTVLLSCMNANNQTWHSMKYIADFSCMSLISINRHIKKLESKRFIFITRPDIYTHKMTNNYSLNIDFIMSFYSKSHISQIPDINIAYLSDTRSHISQIPDRISERYIKKDIKKEIKKGGQKTPLSPDFKPDKQSAELGMDLGFEPSIIDEFMDYCNDKGLTSNDWQARFRKFLRDEEVYRQKKMPAQSSEIKSTVKEYESELVRGNFTHEVAAKSLGDILGKLGITKGAKPNGHGQVEKGKRKAT